MNYKISIEGQEIEMPEEIAGDDDALKSALSPYFPGAANAKFMRSEPKDGVITVTVVKQAGTKGAEAEVLAFDEYPFNDDAELTRAILNSSIKTVDEDQVLRKLINAPEGINPVMELDQKEKEMPAMNQIPFEVMLKRDEEIREAIEIGEIEVSNMAGTRKLLSETKPQPTPMVVPGF
jgi:hypothetical protein